MLAQVNASTRRLLFFQCLVILFISGLISECRQPMQTNLPPKDTISKDTNSIHLLIPTFLGNNQRNYYGNVAPSKLDILWKFYLGEGITVISRKLGERKWAGAGWTGQPLLVMEDSALYIIQGAFDHTLRKIKADSAKVVWQYAFDDVVKGTGTIWDNAAATDWNNRLVIIQGSRLGIGNYVDSRKVPSLRAVSYTSGQELWRLNVKWTDSYSRDADGSTLIIDDTAYLGLENSLFTVYDPDFMDAALLDDMLQPKIFSETKLYTMQDVKRHKRNVVTESSPSQIGRNIYISAGSGHIYGYNIDSARIVWDFYIGSDIDGSPVVTSDSCLLVTVERQYIKGKGGLFKLDPSRDPGHAVIWFLPSENKLFNGWEGGIIGSAGINDSYSSRRDSCLAAVCAIDGHLYIVDHKHVDSTRKVAGPDLRTWYYPPILVYKEFVGPSIATPIFVNDRLIVSGYYGIRLYAIEGLRKFTLLDKFPTSIESTPVAWDNRIYVPARDGFLYCFGEKK